MHFKLIINLLIYLLLNISIYSEETYEIILNETSQKIKIGNQIQFIEDKEGNLSLSEIQTKNLEWMKSKNENANFGFSSFFYWIRFTVNNQTSETLKPILELGWSKLDYIEFYNLKNDKYEVFITGDTFPFRQREIQDTQFAFELECKPNTKQTYYIRTKSQHNLSFLNPSLHKSHHIFHKETSFRDLTNGILYGFLFIMIFYNLLLFLIIKEKVYFYLSIYILSFGYTILSQHGIAFQYLYPENTWLANREGHLHLPFLFIIQIIFIVSYLELKTKLPLIYKFLQIHIVFFVFYYLAINTVFADYLKFHFYFMMGSIFFDNILFLGIGIFLCIKKFRQAYFFMISWIFLLFGLILRALGGASILPLNFVTLWSFQFGLAAMLVLISIGLADKINYLKRTLLEINKQLEDYSEHLEEKIQERTQELQSSLNTVNLLKTQQDGDYFLTSLLLEPFIANKSNSEYLEIDFLLIQKKKFEFYEKEYDIGGDLCHAQNLKINEKNYVLFFNSDSMGKSLQGAGGAIVFGSVFFSIIQRTKTFAANKDLTPERWLKDTFIELHKVFLTFDCTMLVSAVVGLIDEKTGVLYYINAEHPWITLYSDKVSHFIEEDIHFTKLGSPVDTNKLFISIHQLKKDDILLIGSDGRDDFALLTDEILNDLVVNQDEKEFLKTVEEAEGDLHKIYEITCRKGQILDDYSLIRICYLADNSDSTYLKDLSISNYNSQNFQEAIKYGQEYISKNPMDTGFLFFLGTVFLEINNLKKAVNTFEQVRLRNPYSLENLTHLIKAYIKLRNTTRAQKLLKEGILLDPNSLELKQLIEKLESLQT